jgi:hypothetical protein
MSAVLLSIIVGPAAQPMIVVAASATSVTME